jgi:hypothetical protein
LRTCRIRLRSVLLRALIRRSIVFGRLLRLLVGVLHFCLVVDVKVVLLVRHASVHDRVKLLAVDAAQHFLLEQMVVLRFQD